MPPRKSDSSKVATGDEGSVVGVGAGTSTGPGPAKKEDGVNIEDLNLPKSIVTRLAKGVLPPNTQIQGNAMLALSKSATVFVNYLSTNANEYTQTANRKTIAPADVFKALEDLEFDFKDRLEAELAKFNEIQTDKRNTYRKKVAADKAITSSSGGVGAGAAKSGSPAGEGEEAGGGLNGVAAGGAAAAGAVGGEIARGGLRVGDGDDGEPAAKKLRMESAAANGGGARDGEDGEEEDDEEEEEEEEDEEVDDMEEDEEDEEEGEGEEEDDAGEVDDDPPEEALEEPLEERERRDEAMDNGEDSD